MAFCCPETESDFVSKVKSDLTIFLESSSVDSVLVFPPVNSFYRFLIHQLAQDSFDQLRTFSIGEDPDRRIVVCTKDLVARIDSAKDEPYSGLNTSAPSSQLTMVISDAEKSNRSQVKKSKPSLPSVGIYRPPAARRLTEVSTTAPSDSDSVELPAKNATTPARSRARRPDQQVYVPRAKRAFQGSDKVEEVHFLPPEKRTSPRSPSNQATDVPVSDKLRNSTDLIIDNRKYSKQSPTCAPSSVPSRASQLVETKKKLCQSVSSDLDLECIESNISGDTGRLASNMSGHTVNLPPRAEVLVEKKKKLCQTNSSSEEYKWKSIEGESNGQESRFEDVIAEPNFAFTDYKLILQSNSAGKSDSEDVSVIDSRVTNSSSSLGVGVKCDIDKKVRGLDIKQTSDTVFKEQTSTDVVSSQNGMKMGDDCENMTSKKSIQRESSDEDLGNSKSNKPCNMSDQSSGGSSESLSSSDSVNSPVTHVQLMKPVKVDSKKKASPAKSSPIFNPDECDWDALLDEDGDVLDPFLMKELTSAVGEVQVTQPKSDYRNYRSQVPVDHQKSRRSTADEDFSHVVEIFSFPPEFKTNDLVAVFSPFKNAGGGFEIKWVDDTHALGVFASALVAEQVLEYHHPMVRTRPLSDGTLESRLKARRLSESIQSFRPRPETCAALARRLVTGALGLKLATARQEREEEKRVLKEAREKRRLAAQQRDDIWNSG